MARTVHRWPNQHRSCCYLHFDLNSLCHCYSSPKHNNKICELIGFELLANQFANYSVPWNFSELIANFMNFFLNFTNYLQFFFFSLVGLRSSVQAQCIILNYTLIIPELQFFYFAKYSWIIRLSLCSRKVISLKLEILWTVDIKID